MRLASIALRDVRSKRFFLHPHPPFSRHRSQRPPWDTGLSPTQYIRCCQRYFSGGASGSSEPSAILSDLADSLRATQSPAQQRDPAFPLIQKMKLFGKWSSLVTDPHRLSIESDFYRRGPAKNWNRELLVDKFENHGDFALWSCLLDYQQRINGDAGVVDVWRGLWGRKSLHQVHSPLALVFWQTVLETAVTLNNDEFLTGIWIYSEWMYDLYGVKWPHLYATVMTHFLQTHQHQRVLQWQLRLALHFYPGPEEFARIVKHFASDPELYRKPTLETLYTINRDHQLYDILVPHLYNLGASQLARRWRRICTCYDDVPLDPRSAAPFLRFMQGYFSYETLLPEETAVLSGPEPQPLNDGDRVDISREFMNRVEGSTFGISVKNYDDSLGAQWLASSWVSLDTGISTISALGIEQIGPLSLQSIALREGTSAGVLKRVEQLAEHGISVVDSNYRRLVLYLANIKDDELLLDLLGSDFHPDVFEDSNLQAQLILSTAQAEDWRTHRLLLVTRLVVMEKSAREASNILAHTYILRKDRLGLWKLLGDMKTMNLQINREHTDLLFESLLTEAKSTFLPQESLYFHLSICRQLTSMEVAVPIRCWRKLLFCLARQGRIDHLEKVCVELVDLFASSESSRPGFVLMHPDDVPEPMRKSQPDIENPQGIYFPLDLPSKLRLHPLRQLFDIKLLGTIVRCSFYFSLSRRRRIAPLFRDRPQLPFGSDCGRVVRLMRVLCGKGLFLDRMRLATWIKVRLVSLYGPTYPLKRDWQIIRASNSWTLERMKELLDEAWGGELLPPIEDLRADIEKRGRKIVEKDAEFVESIGMPARRVHRVI
ncbi:hypothetical protein GGS23DRAFT_546906 [Durotheca rogersii]|uniref:uncharacterized protein n=1 Tax=Durotheca rogersii TaxID=419775 RepID=UPI00221FF9E2|nr:uncharacterized protein GGS23DRAFT_546906 [Durotheca rogersii]KAI5867136.1 hypothetical protein GGS23DRAFT_546906 [Durotheca rogersii]